MRFCEFHVVFSGISSGSAPSTTVALGRSLFSSEYYQEELATDTNSRKILTNPIIVVSHNSFRFKYTYFVSYIYIYIPRAVRELFRIISPQTAKIYVLYVCNMFQFVHECTPCARPSLRFRLARDYYGVYRYIVRTAVGSLYSRPRQKNRPSWRPQSASVVKGTPRRHR